MKRKENLGPKWVDSTPTIWERILQNVKEDACARETPCPPDDAEMFKFLGARTTKLPSPLTLAQIAAVTGPANEPDRALGTAAWLYLKAVVFCQTFDKATAEERACLCRQYDVASVSPGFVAEQPTIDTSLSLPEYFLKEIVSGKTSSVREERVKSFFRAQSPEGEDQETFAEKMLENLKSDKLYMEELVENYRDWWKRTKSESASESAGRRKSVGRKKTSSRKKTS